MSGNQAMGVGEVSVQAVPKGEVREQGHGETPVTDKEEPMQAPRERTGAEGWLYPVKSKTG